MIRSRQIDSIWVYLFTYLLKFLAFRLVRMNLTKGQLVFCLLQQLSFKGFCFTKKNNQTNSLLIISSVSLKQVWKNFYYFSLTICYYSWRMNHFYHKDYSISSFYIISSKIHNESKLFCQVCIPKSSTWKGLGHRRRGLSNSRRLPLAKLKKAIKRPN